MSLESGGFIKDLVTTNPEGTDPKSQGDDHLRLIKAVLKGQFAGLTLGKPIMLTEDQLNTAVVTGMAGLNGFGERVTGMPNTNLNALPDRSGFYSIMGTAVNGWPAIQQGDMVINMVWAATVAVQIGVSYSTGLTWARANTGGTWKGWHCLSEMGFGQSWQQPGRAFNTNYTNSSGRAIMVNICGACNPAGASALNCYVAGVQVAQATSPNQFTAVSVSFIVPNGAAYACNPTAAFTLTSWAELR